VTTKSRIKVVNNIAKAFLPPFPHSATSVAEKSRINDGFDIDSRSLIQNAPDEAGQEEQS